MVLKWCNSDVTVVSQWWYSGGTVVLQVAFEPAHQTGALFVFVWVWVCVCVCVGVCVCVCVCVCVRVCVGIVILMYACGRRRPCSYNRGVTKVLQ
jgi:hypothetical protein